jgi:hypothetical protein
MDIVVVDGGGWWWLFGSESVRVNVIVLKKMMMTFGFIVTF